MITSVFETDRSSTARTPMLPAPPALFALAKYFSEHKPANSILFVAFDGEESGLRGSQAFVNRPPVPVDQLSINLNADMIGRDPNDKLFVVEPPCSHF